MKRVIAIAVLATLSLAVIASDLSGLPAPLVEKDAVARQACANFKNGEFALEWGASTRTDLGGDLHPDWVLDESACACPTAASLFCSTGGCMSHFSVGDVFTSFRNQGWTVLTTVRNRVLLTDVHASDYAGSLRRLATSPGYGSKMRKCGGPLWEIWSNGALPIASDSTGGS